MRRIVAPLLFLACVAGLLPAAPPPAKPPAIFNRVRFIPILGYEKSMLGGRFSGSNISKTEGFHLLAEIKTIPAANQWTELTLPNPKVYRWIRYEGAPGTCGRVARLEFYDGAQKLSGDFYGTFSSGGFMRAVDGRPRPVTSGFQGDHPDGQYIGLDLGFAATPPAPVFNPPRGVYPAPISVSLESAVPGATIRYTTDGTMPTPQNSRVYSAPIKIDKTTTISAVLCAPGRAPTRTVEATFIIGDAIHTHSFHLGNSLTGITRYTPQAYTAGIDDDAHSYTIGGGLTKTLWNAAMLPLADPKNQAQWKSLYNSPIELPPMGYAPEAIQNGKKQWPDRWNATTQVDDLTLQPRDFDIAEEADYDVRFLNLIGQKSPAFQPWLYIEWVEKDRKRPTDLGTEPTTEMKKVWPAATWEESMAAMVLYGEDLQRKIGETYHGAKPVRVIPIALAMGWIRHMVEHGEVPGIGRDEFYEKLFGDQVHPNIDGAFLVDCTWYAAFRGESPEGKFLPILTDLTPAQARIMQRLAWDVVKNYPGSGLYEEGTTPCTAPKISPVTQPIKNSAPVTLTSATPGAWFRYTLDGTPPARTNGYIYCGVITVRPGMKLQVLAYKSGMADSAVVSATYPVP